MPITFEQPAPMAPSITEGGGMAEQFSRDLPSLASLYGAAIHASASTAAAAIGAQAHVQASMDQAAAQEDASQAQEREYNLSRYVSPHDTFMAQHQANMATLDANNRAALQSLGMTQAEQLQANQIRNNIGQIQVAEQQGLLTHDDAVTATARQFGVLQPMLERERMQKAKQMSDANDQAATAAAHGTTATVMQKKSVADFYNSGQGDVIKDGVKGYIDDKNNFKPYETGKSQQQFIQDYMKDWAESQKAVDAEVKRADAAKGVGVDGKTSDWTPAMKDEMLANEIKKRQDARQAAAAAYAAQRAQAQQQQAPPQTGGPPQGQPAAPQQGAPNQAQQVPPAPPPEMKQASSPPLPNSMMAQFPALDSAINDAGDRMASKLGEHGVRDSLPHVQTVRSYFKTYPNFSSIPPMQQPRFLDSARRLATYSPQLRKMFGR